MILLFRAWYNFFMEPGRKIKLSPLQTSILIGSFFGLLTGLLLVFGFNSTSERLSRHFVLVVSLPLALGATLGLLYWWRRFTWLYFSIAGALLGLEEAFSLFMTPLFERQFLVGVFTFTFFVTLGIAIGGLFEGIRFLHKLTHSGKLRNHPRLK